MGAFSSDFLTAFAANGASVLSAMRAIGLGRSHRDRVYKLLKVNGEFRTEFDRIRADARTPRSKKLCVRCGAVKPIAQFYTREHGGPPRGHCIECHLVEGRFKRDLKHSDVPCIDCGSVFRQSRTGCNRCPRCVPKRRYCANCGHFLCRTKNNRILYCNQVCRRAHQRTKSYAYRAIKARGRRQNDRREQAPSHRLCRDCGASFMGRTCSKRCSECQLAHNKTVVIASKRRRAQARGDVDKASRNERLFAKRWMPILGQEGYHAARLLLEFQRKTRRPADSPR